MPITVALFNLTQEDCEFEVNLGYIAGYRLAWSTYIA
jgi:hypothetical protein